MDKNQIDKCNHLIDFIKSLEEEFIGLYDGLEVSNKQALYHLPSDFKYFLSWSNGFSLFGAEILGIGNKEYDLIKTTKWEQSESNNIMPIFIVPFSPVGNGDFYCFDLKEGLNEDGLCPIIYWQWNYSNSERYEKVNDSFIEWLKELIEDSLSDEEE